MTQLSPSVATFVALEQTVEKLQARQAENDSLRDRLSDSERAVSELRHELHRTKAALLAPLAEPLYWHGQRPHNPQTNQTAQEPTAQDAPGRTLDPGPIPDPKLAQDLRLLKAESRSLRIILAALASQHPEGLTISASAFLDVDPLGTIFENERPDGAMTVFYRPTVAQLPPGPAPQPTPADAPAQPAGKPQPHPPPEHAKPQTAETT